MILQKGGSVYIDVPKLIMDCCVSLSECPSIKLGKPPKVSEFFEDKIHGVILYRPKDFCEDDLEIRVSRFLGFSRLVLEGWKMI